MQKDQLIDSLNDKKLKRRLHALKKLKHLEKRDKTLVPVVRENDANNHIHTFYSFSPYSPSKAAYMAYKSGLETMGIMDHDTLSGAKEFIKACEILGTHSTVGFECRVHYAVKGQKGRKINNPDENDCAYVAVHGIPHQNIDKINEALEEYRIKRQMRDNKMVDKLNKAFAPHGISIDFSQDVLPLSKAEEGGSVTERHIVMALAKKIIEKFGRGEATLNFVADTLGINVSKKAREQLLTIDNPFYDYDLLGVLKSDIRSFYIRTDEECMDIRDFARFAKDSGGILAYAYLGDVAESPTGDKRAQKLEDGYLEDLLCELKEIGFDAVAYMPTRNTPEQLKRLRGLCEKYDLFEISGEDINSPRQRFECAALKDEEFSNLIESTWALIGHEKIVSGDLSGGMFSEKAKKNCPKLADRIKLYAEIGRRG